MASRFKTEKRKHRVLKRQEAKGDYRHRYRILQRIGFKTYAQYLASPTWKRIKEAKLKLKPNCETCELPAYTVHHRFYSLQNLLGHDLTGLWSICRKCHYKTEIDKSGTKRSIDQSQEEHTKLLKTKKYRVWTPHSFGYDLLLREPSSDLDTECAQRVEREV